MGGVFSRNQIFILQGWVNLITPQMPLIALYYSCSEWPNQIIPPVRFSNKKINVVLTHNHHIIRTQTLKRYCFESGLFRRKQHYLDIWKFFSQGALLRSCRDMGEYDENIHQITCDIIISFDVWYIIFDTILNIKKNALQNFVFDNCI